MSFLLGALVGAVIGVVVAVVLQPPLERWYAKGQSRMRRFVPRRAGSTGSDLEKIGLFQVLAWSPARPLDPSLHQVRFDPSDRATQEWFPDSTWTQERDKARAHVNGVVADVTGYSVDHGEAGVESERFTLLVRSSSYADAVAMQALTNTDACWPDVEEYFREAGTKRALETGPPQSLFVALSLMSADFRVLALRRASAAVATSGGLWSLGVCETMTAPPSLPGQTPESLFEVARRAALEEIGLGAEDLGPIWFSWFGFSRCDGLMAVAHVKTSLTSDEVDQRILSSHGTYEADGIRWFDIQSDDLSSLAEQRVHVGWLGFTCLVARDHKRFWSILDAEPRRT